VAREQAVASEDTGLTAILSPLLGSDIAAIARWYARATVLAGSPIPLSALLGSSEQVLVLTASGGEDPVGLAVLSIDNPEPGWATVNLLAVAGQEQRELAAHAVALLEADLRPHVSRVRAAVPPDAGLALYFWLRLGYRPAVFGGRLWMTRDLDA
jgi:hypothetical protein